MSLTAPAAPETEPRPVRAAPTPWLQNLALFVVLLIPPVAYLNNLSFAILAALGGILCLPLLLRPRQPILGIGILALLAGWAVLSMRWTAYRFPAPLAELSIEDVTALKMLLELGLNGAFISGILALAPLSARRVSLVLAGGMVVLAAVFLIEGVAKGQGYIWLRSRIGESTDPAIAIRDVGRAAYTLAVLFWPMALRLFRHGRGAAVLFVTAATVIGSTLLGADAPIAALIVSIIGFFAVLKFGRRAVWACLVGVLVYLAFAPLVVNALTPPDSALNGAMGAEHLSWSIRIDIWRFAVERILERPFLGWGLDASRMFSPDILLHTHNAALQIWLELGAVGIALFALFWAWLFARIDAIEETDRPMAAAATATACAYLTIGALSFGVWQEWWIALGVIAAAACIMLAKARQIGRSAPQGLEPAA